MNRCIDHASDTVTRCSRTAFFGLFKLCASILVSKKQNSVESSSFGSKFIAMKQCCEYICGLRYKLRMMGISCDDLTFIYGDNQSVLANTTSWVQVVDTRRRPCRFSTNEIFCNRLKVLVIGHFRIRTPQCLQQ